MPFGDGSGPQGAGPRTGRGLGFCAGYAQPGYASGGPGMGRGMGRGWGRGGGRGWGRGMAWGRGWGRSAPQAWAPASYPPAYAPAPLTPEQETDSLRDQVAFHEESLAALKKRLEMLETASKD